MSLKSIAKEKFTKQVLRTLPILQIKEAADNLKGKATPVQAKKEFKRLFLRDPSSEEVKVILGTFKSRKMGLK